jgi:hypothetical protein
LGTKIALRRSGCEAALKKSLSTWSWIHDYDHREWYGGSAEDGLDALVPA